MRILGLSAYYHDSAVALCAGEYVELEEIDNGIWNVYFGPLKLGRLLEDHMRIERKAQAQNGKILSRFCLPQAVPRP